MWTWLIRLGVGGVLAYWISGTTGVSFPVVFLAVVGLYVYFTKFHHAGGHATGGAHGHAAGHGGVLHGVKHTIVGLAVFTALMMIVTRLMRVSGQYAFGTLGELGWRFWLWPSQIPVDLILWVSVTMLVAGLAGRAADGDRKLTTKIFVGSAIVTFLIMWLPQTAVSVAPAPTWEGSDAVISEKGTVPTAVRSGWRFAFGDLASKKGVLPKVGNAISVWAWGDEEPKPTAVSTATVQPSAVARQPRPAVKTGPHPFGENGCTTAYIDETVVAYPIGGKVITTATDGKDYPIEPGVDPVGDDRMPAQDAGWFKFCRAEGSLATRVDIRR